MSEYVAKTKAFIESSSAFCQALQPLSDGVEIGLNIAGQEGALSRDGEKVYYHARLPRKADVTFSLSTAAVDVLVECPADDIGAIAIAVMKQIQAGQVKIRVTGGLLDLLSHGYLEIVQAGGKPVWNYLKERGLANPTKIIGLFKKFRK